MNAHSQIVIAARSLATKYYPNCPCIILTGSQMEPDKVTKQSDIDILLFGEYFSGVSANATTDGDYKVDFTKVNLLDISSILIDHAYDHKGVILHMIMTGMIIKDDLGVLKEIQLKAKMFYEAGHASLSFEVLNMRNNLKRVKKNLLKNLNARYDFFLVMEFTHLVSSLQILSKNGWYPSSSYRRTNDLLEIDKNANLIDNLMELVRESFDRKPKNKSKIINFIDKYLNTALNEDLNKGFDERFIVNLAYKHQSINDFYTKVIASIIDSPYLSELYVHSGTHNTKHTFKHYYVLVFDNHHRNFNENKVLDILYDIFDSLKKPITNLQLVSSEFIYREFFEIKLYNCLENLLSNLSASMHKMYVNSSSNILPKLFLLYQVLIIQLSKSFRLSKDDFRNYMAFLYIKWRYSNISSVSTSDDDLTSFNARIKNKALSYYNSNNGTLNSIHEASWGNPEGIVSDDVEINGLIQFINTYAKETMVVEVQLDNIILQSLSPYVLDKNKLKEAYFFTLAATKILNIFCIDHSLHSILAHSLIESSRFYEDKLHIA